MNLLAASSDPRAIPSLEVFASPPHRLLALVTAPARPRGRGRKAEPSELALWAAARGIPLLQPEDIHNALPEIARLTPEAIAVIAYGQKLKPELLRLPPLGCLNLHPSLLPRWRGAAPIPRAILAGDGETGVSILRMVDRMDAGAVLAQRREPIRPDDTAESLGERLFTIGAEMFREVLASPLPPGEPQDEAKATRAPMLRKEEGRIDWAREAAEIDRKVRALQPWPTAYAFLEGLRITIWKARRAAGSGPPGALLSPAPLTVACGTGALILEELQAEGKRRMGAADYVRGARLGPGAAFS